MNAALVWSVIFLGTGNLLQAAERWHMADKFGDRVRVVAPPKDKPAPKDKADAGEQAPADDERPISVLGGESTGEVTAA